MVETQLIVGHLYARDAACRNETNAIPVSHVPVPFYELSLPFWVVCWRDLQDWRRRFMSPRLIRNKHPRDKMETVVPTVFLESVLIRATKPFCYFELCKLSASRADQFG